MKNFKQEGKILNYTVVGADVVSGQAIKVGSVFGVCLKDALIGEVVPLDTEGVFELPKDASVVTGLGHDLYWDNTAKKVTITSAGNMHIGQATEAAATGVATVIVKLAPSKVSPADNIAAVATADGSDAATTQALANALKVSLNDLLVKLKAAGLMDADA